MFQNRSRGHLHPHCFRCQKPAIKKKVRHLLLGSEAALQQVIQTLHVLGYAEVNHWTRPLPTGRPGEVMRILTKHLVVD